MCHIPILSVCPGESLAGAPPRTPCCTPNGGGLCLSQASTASSCTNGSGCISVHHPFTGNANNAINHQVLESQPVLGIRQEYEALHHKQANAMERAEEILRELSARCPFCRSFSCDGKERGCLPYGRCIVCPGSHRKAQCPWLHSAPWGKDLNFKLRSKKVCTVCYDWGCQGVYSDSNHNARHRTMKRLHELLVREAARRGVDQEGWGDFVWSIYRDSSTLYQFFGDIDLQSMRTTHRNGLP